MLKSKLAGFIVDCKTDDLESAAAFWSAALGMDKHALPGSEGHKYVRLMDPNERLDVEAEVRRLEKLGAKRVAQIRTWWVMQAPTGQKFCVVRPQSRDFVERAHDWD